MVDLSYLLISECPVNSNTIALSGAAKVLMASWEAVSDEVRRVFIEADSKHDTLNTIDLGAHRVYTVAEATLWASFGGVSFATQVATVVSREAPAARFGKKIGSLFKEAKAIKFSQSTPMSVLKFFQSSVFSPAKVALASSSTAPGSTRPCPASPTSSTRPPRPLRRAGRTSPTTSTSPAR